MTEPINTTVAAVSLVTLAAAVFGPTAGPYIVITLGSIGGALWALSSATIATHTQGAWLLLRCVLTAIVLTALVSSIVGPLINLPVTESYAVVAFGIGALGNQWLEILATLKRRFIAAIEAGGKP